MKKKSPKGKSFSVKYEVVNNPDPKAVYINMLEWLYTMDGSLKSRLQWREALCQKLKEELGLALKFPF